mgnify:CR=1 FL=1
MRMKIKKWLAAFTVAAGMVLPARLPLPLRMKRLSRRWKHLRQQRRQYRRKNRRRQRKHLFLFRGTEVWQMINQGTAQKSSLRYRQRTAIRFFLVLDRSSNKENVYMLSMIDEDDLAEFVTETKKQETEQPTVITPQPETKPAVEETEKEPEKEVKRLIPGRCLPLRCLP